MKRFFVSIVLLIIIILFFSLLLPDKIHIEKALTINSSANQIFEEINTPRNWQKWSPWYKMDPEMQIFYEGPDSGTGAGYTWISKVNGKGKLVITESRPYDIIVTDFTLGFAKQIKTIYRLQETKDGIKVTCILETGNSFPPLSRFYALYFEKQLKVNFEKSLVNIKELVENQNTRMVMIGDNINPH